ncbi:hypothetical protein [Pseudoclavibacter sp. RFBB5]|uniref:hypothetical protein n=1 Tax=Pseudoclavibacter sp. RFBB5 TaxID=2080574 RepID=UPI000CE7E379|nr:hypothetical protein [Pseudoclavibacter sp. RFBB5]PPG29660.1 hypothetical protein C5B97_11870 [Pseudoclavibacter sp. RFBB5]
MSEATGRRLPSEEELDAALNAFIRAVLNRGDHSVLMAGTKDRLRGPVRAALMAAKGVNQ